MERVSIVSFTAKGKQLSMRVRAALLQEMEMELYCKSGQWAEQAEEEGAEILFLKAGIAQWAKEQFFRKRGMLFIGACGIAVRAIAPWVKDKLTDVPVLVMDEAGRFVIPVLAGHYGGANELAEKIAEKMGAIAVITTATDVNGMFSPDVFAVKNHLIIGNRDGIKKVSSAILRKEPVMLTVEGVTEGDIPEELTYIGKGEKEGDAEWILVSPYEPEEMPSLWLCPKAFYIGIGCRRGKTPEEIETAVLFSLEKMRIPMEAVAGIASIDIKQREEGLSAFADKYSLPFLVFSKEELLKVEGEFTPSHFVKERTGVENVCERASLAACREGGRLILKKQPVNGITVAAAERKWSVVFGET